MKLTTKIRVYGIVQGVGFRPFIYRIANKNDLKGVVLNRGDAIVEVTVTGEKKHIEQFISELKGKHPPASIIERIECESNERIVKFDDFKILPSSIVRSTRGSTIPADISICDNCLRELRKPSDRRYRYFFITCTDCGPRFTVINNLPYDRINTTMDHFKLCNECRQEFKDPLDRRFHAQTIACRTCGPKADLIDSDSVKVDDVDPISTAGKLLEEGFIVAVKGNGGFHLAASTIDSSPIKKLRKAKYRSQKPFAIIAKDVKTIRGFAQLSDKEENLLTSSAHPIVLLQKSGDFYLSDLISPHLNSIGVMLPYTGLHVMLFDRTRDPAFIMTSANPPSEPIIMDNDEALSRLNNVADYFLLHDRKIRHRCDDSVLKMISGSVGFIRRSRGYTPLPIRLKKKSKTAVLGMGAEQNVTACLLMDDKAFMTQHVGDIETAASLDFLRESIEEIEKLTNCVFERIACDLHPGFHTTRLAEQFASEYGSPLRRVQHHHAHSAKLMVEHALDELVSIVCDGFGYGTDGNAWGGEVLHCHGDQFERIGHLEEHHLIGGDFAARYPLRIAAGIIGDSSEFQEWLTSMKDSFPHGLTEVDLILKMAKRMKGVMTSSCGRVLDAVSGLLEVCVERTYEGEPAMKLESTAEGGVDVLNIRPVLKSDTLLTKPLLEEIFLSKDKHRKCDLAYSCEQYLGNGLAEMAVEKAETLGVEAIGFTGGVAYNNHITTTIKNTVEEDGYQMILQKNIPCGDGGLSLGQAYLTAYPLRTY